MLSRNQNGDCNCGCSEDCLGNKFENFFYLPAVGTCGGILLAWDASVVALSNPHYTENTLTTLVKPFEGVQWWITGVYGLQLDHEKILFMQELVDSRASHRTVDSGGGFQSPSKPRGQE